MRSTRSSRIIVGLVAVLLLTAACAAQPGGAIAPPPLPGMTPVPVAGLPEAPPPAPVTLTAAQVSAALLGPADVPPGWTQVPAGSGVVARADESAGTSTWEPATCRDLAMAGSPGAGDVGNGTQFTTADNHVALEMIVSWQSDPVATMIDGMKAFVAGCPTVVLSTSDGVRITEHVVEAPVAQVGDHTAGYASDAAIGGRVGSYSYQAVVTVGHVSVLVLVSGTTMLDQATLDQLVTTAVAKVQALS